jgi:hypothetical protein
MSRLVATRFTSSWPPVASMPLAMKTMVSVFATVQMNHAKSHQM